MKFIIAIGFFLVSLLGVTQGAIDSLEHQLTTDKSEEDKFEIISSLVDLYGDKPEAELYLKSLLDVGEKGGGELNAKAFKKAYSFYSKKDGVKIGLPYLLKAIDFEKKNKLETINNSYELLGQYFQAEVELDSAVYYFQRSAEGYEENNDDKNLVEVLNKQGVLFKNIQNYGEALKVYYKAYDIAKQQKMDGNLASTCINLGVVFKNQDQLTEAMSYYQEAEAIYLKQLDYIGLANVYNNIGNIHRLKDEFSKALDFYKKAIENRKLGGSEKTLSYSYNNIALVFKEQMHYDSALFYLKLSEEYKIKLKEHSSMSSTYMNFADLYSILDDSTNFIKYYLQTKEFALKYGQYAIIEELNILYSKYAASKGNYKDAYDYLIAVIQQMDTLSNKEQEVLSQVLQAQYNDKQKQELIIDLEKSLNKQNKQAEELKQKEENLWLLIVVLVFVFLLLSIVLVMMFRSFNRLKMSAKEYELINRELNETRMGAEEKEMMIKEIHHRVKNNLQVVKSLIRLQRDGVGAESASLLTDFENRVSSIALVHESLHGSIDLTKVDVEDYYSKLIKDLIEVYSVGQEISSSLQIGKLSFGLDTLIPLGLLTNEIVSNALKHGFKGRSHGHLSVKIDHLKDETYLLEITDDGVGISADYLAKGSLGLELIDTLIGQLDGTKELIVENGTKYKITFKNQDKIKKDENSELRRR